MPIRIALGEDSLIVREGVHQLLAVDPEVEIVAAVADQFSLRQACEEHDPDVVLTDIRMPPTHTDEGIRLAAELRESHPRIGVVILSQFSDPTYALALLEHGSDGRAYLLKERVSNRAELMAAIRAVVAGGSMIDPKVVEALVVARGRAHALTAQRAHRPRAGGPRRDRSGKEQHRDRRRAVPDQARRREAHQRDLLEARPRRRRGRQQAREGCPDVPVRGRRQPRQLTRRTSEA